MRNPFTDLVKQYGNLDYNPDSLTRDFLINFIWSYYPELSKDNAFITSYADMIESLFTMRNHYAKLFGIDLNKANRDIGVLTNMILDI